MISPPFVPAKAGTQSCPIAPSAFGQNWIPAFAGMNGCSLSTLLHLNRLQQQLRQLLRLIHHGVVAGRQLVRLPRGMPSPPSPERPHATANWSMSPDWTPTNWFSAR